MARTASAPSRCVRISRVIPRAQGPDLREICSIHTSRGLREGRVPKREPGLSSFLGVRMVRMPRVEPEFQVSRRREGVSTVYSKRRTSSSSHATLRGIAAIGAWAACSVERFEHLRFAGLRNRGGRPDHGAGGPGL